MTYAQGSRGEALAEDAYYQEPEWEDDEDTGADDRAWEQMKEEWE